VGKSVVEDVNAVVLEVDELEDELPSISSTLNARIFCTNF
jgi:hypothetical protein